VQSSLLGSLPIHALERQTPDGRVGYVVERVAVDYIPAWTALMFPTKPSSRLRTIVAFGNPTGKNWSVDYELRDIRSFFRSADVFIGQEATWQNISSSKPDLLQISSEFQKGFDLCGTFTVSEGGVSEQTREAAFLSLLELEAPPVVLLTNQSGSGQELGPDHALLLRMNGTSDVFLNRWIADRKAAKFFSEFFFTHLSNGLAPGDAYRQALLNLIQTRENAHPRSWAQFFHFGTG
jgi:CHAT domain-containing protein